MSFSGTLKALHERKISPKDLRGASFAFNCDKAHVLHPNGLVPIEVAMLNSQGLPANIDGNAKHVLPECCEPESMETWDMLWGAVVAADAFDQVVYRADLMRYALEPLRRGDQVWFGERWLTLEEVEHHLRPCNAQGDPFDGGLGTGTQNPHISCGAFCD